jgi:quercetin dioxygenase-like cupin family protein
MAEVFGVDMGTLFQSDHDGMSPVVFKKADMQATALPDMTDNGVKCWRVPRIETESRHTPRLIEIPPRTKLARHFFQIKGDELGYLISGTLRLTYRDREYQLAEGDFIYFKEGWPSAWNNPGQKTAHLLWLLTGRP